MHLLRASLVVLLAGALLASPAFAKRTHHTTHATAKSTHSTAKPTRHSAKSASHSAKARRTAYHGSRRSRRHILHGQQVIQPERVTQIQQALIKAHYFSGEADGQWDSTTIAAMQKYQADHGWQTKLMPDSRALKALGLGPDYSNAMNADQTAFGAQVPTGDIPSTEQVGFAQASGVNQ